MASATTAARTRYVDRCRQSGFCNASPLGRGRARGQARVGSVGSHVIRRLAFALSAPDLAIALLVFVLWRPIVSLATRKTATPWARRAAKRLQPSASRQTSGPGFGIMPAASCSRDPKWTAYAARFCQEASTMEPFFTASATSPSNVGAANNNAEWRSPHSVNRQMRMRSLSLGDRRKTP